MRHNFVFFPNLKSGIPSPMFMFTARAFLSYFFISSASKLIIEIDWVLVLTFVKRFKSFWIKCASMTIAYTKLWNESVHSRYNPTPECTELTIKPYTPPGVYQSIQNHGSRNPKIYWNQVQIYFFLSRNILRPRRKRPQNAINVHFISNTIHAFFIYKI